MWGVASRSDSQLVLFGRAKEVELENEAPYADALLTNDGSGWRFASWGQCRILVDAPGFGPARVVFNPEIDPDPESTELHVSIRERACAGGQPPTDRDVIPVIVADEQRIVITMLVSESMATPPVKGTPWHPTSVTLDQPLGDRQVFDGITVPPEPLLGPSSKKDLDL